MIHPATQYALDAVEGTIIVGRWEKLACLRHLHDLARSGQLPNKLAVRIQQATGRPVPEHDKDWPWIFDEVQATFVAINWFKYFRHIEGKLTGQPIVLIPAHVFDISCIFGWTSREPKFIRKDGRKVGERRFRKALLTEGRKNAKTTRLSVIALYLMVGDSEFNPKVYCAAVDRNQARELYEKSKLMAENSPDVSKRLNIRDYMISHRTRHGKMAPLSKDTKNKDGLNPSGAIIDEYAQHPTSEIYDLISSAKGQRLQPLMVIISTAGDDVESPMYAEEEYCRLIVEGSISTRSDATNNERYFVVIRKMDEGDDEHDMKNWIKANPLLGVTADGLLELKDMHDEAFGSKNVKKINTFRIKNLNIWSKGNEASYMGEYMISDGTKPSQWDQCAVSRDEFLRLTYKLLCVVGVDLSKKIDLTALAYVFALKDGRTAISAHGFIPEGAVKHHEKTDRIPYREWAKMGWLTITEGDVVDYTSLEDQIEFIQRQKDVKAAKQMALHYAIGNGWKVSEIAYDPYNATHFKNNMDKKGYTTIEVRQTMPNLNEPTKLFRELVAGGKLVHDGSPLLTWCVGNAQEIVDTKENTMITKKKSKDTKRVDLLAASIDGLFRVQPLREATAYDDYVDSAEFGF
jgi:phage terminase large subunit-like protein